MKAATLTRCKMKRAPYHVGEWLYFVDEFAEHPQRRYQVVSIHKIGAGVLIVAQRGNRFVSGTPRRFSIRPGKPALGR